MSKEVIDFAFKIKDFCLLNVNTDSYRFFIVGLRFSIVDSNHEMNTDQKRVNINVSITKNNPISVETISEGKNEQKRKQTISNVLIKSAKKHLFFLKPYHSNLNFFKTLFI